MANAAARVSSAGSARPAAADRRPPAITGATRFTRLVSYNVYTRLRRGSTTAAAITVPAVRLQCNGRGASRRSNSLREPGCRTALCAGVCASTLASVGNAAGKQARGTIGSDCTCAYAPDVLQ